MMWIKICGTTNLEDALASVEAGADALGFIFAPSPRRISPKEAAKIIRELPPGVEKIGVSVNQKIEIVVQTANEAGLTGVQLHGDEDADYIAELKRSLSRKQMRIIRAIRVRDGFETAFDQYSGESATDLFLLDSAGTTRGGTGERFDWPMAAPIVRLAARRYRIVVAGGLTAANVAQAIAEFRPFGVDVVSGVEREPGRKDHAKVRGFVAAARGIDWRPRTADSSPSLRSGLRKNALRQNRSE